MCLFYDPLSRVFLLIGFLFFEVKMPRKFGYCSRFNVFLAVKNERVFTLYRGRCKQWSCPECSQYLRSKWRAHLAERISELGGLWCFITVTAPSYKKRPFNEQLSLSAKLFKEKMKPLFQFIRDNWGNHQYVRVLEIQKRGAIHAHILMNFHFPETDIVEIRRGKNKGRCYVPKLKKHAVKLGFGHQIDVEHLVGQALQVSVYLTKYITKESREYESWLPKNTRYIQSSQGIGALNKHKYPEDEWTVIKPSQVRRLIVDHFEIYDGDKKKFVELSDISESGDYEI